MKRALLFVLLAGAALSITGCGRKSADDQVLARVGGRQVTVGEFRIAMARRAAVSPKMFSDVQNKKELLNELVRFELMADAAQQKGLFDDPEVRRATELFAVNRLQMDILSAVSNDVQVTAQEAAEYYSAHAEEFETPERARVAVLHIAVPTAAPDAKKRELLAKANKIRQEAAALPANTPNFGSLAAKYSDDQATRYKGGDAGWLNRESAGGRWSSDVVKVAFMLKQPGELSPVISSDRGFYILKLIEHRNASRVPLVEVSAGIRRQLEDQRRRDVIEKYIAGLEKDASVKVDESLLAAIEPPVRGKEKKGSP